MRKAMRTGARGLLVPCLVLAAACGRQFEGGGDLRAQRVVLDREVEGLRAVVERMERGEPMLPADDVAIAIDDALIRDLIVAQLPFDADVDRYHLRLTGADVQFRGSPVGAAERRAPGARPAEPGRRRHAHRRTGGRAGRPAGVDAHGTVAADHLSIDEATGLTQLLSGATIDEVARAVRLEIREQLPTIQIPVKVQQQIAFPAVTDGPVRMAGARLPLEVAVSQVMAARGRLWICVRVTPGAFVKTPTRPQPATPAPAMPRGARRPAPASSSPPRPSMTRCARP